MPAAPAAIETKQTPRQLRPHIRETLKRQTQQIGKAISKRVALDKPLGLAGDFHTEELKQIVSRSHHRHFEFIKAGPSLILGALRQPSLALGRSLRRQLAQPGELIKEVDSWVLKILNENLKDMNSIHMGTIGAAKGDLITPIDMPPMLWRPIPEDVLHDILFAKILIITLYNPAHLLQKLQEQGFEIIKSKKDARYILRRNLNGRSIEFHNVEYFKRFIQQALMTENSVVEMIDKMIRGAASKELSGPTKIKLAPSIVTSALSDE